MFFLVTEKDRNIPVKHQELSVTHLLYYILKDKLVTMFKVANGIGEEVVFPT